MSLEEQIFCRTPYWVLLYQLSALNFIENHNQLVIMSYSSVSTYFSLFLLMKNITTATITIMTKMAKIVRPTIKPLLGDLLELFPLGEAAAIVDDCVVEICSLPRDVVAEIFGAKVGLSSLTTRK
jgi:ABC-type enterobactin transport system permease subunit